MKQRIVIYQVLPRLFGNNTVQCKKNGTITENGCGKMADFTAKALNAIKSLGVTHIWYTGLLEHATQTHYDGIQQDHPAVVKGKAGSPYAIKDYYDIDPDLAVKPAERMEEFKSLLFRSHRSNLKVIIDFIPNHVARQYHSDAKPEGVEDFGEKDDKNVAFSPMNNYYYIPGKKLEGSIDFYAGQENPYVEMPAKATGNDRFDAFVNVNDWYETVKLNYGVDSYHNGHFNPIPDTWLKMRDILLFWADKGVDGFRCDMVEMVPVEFWGWVIPQVKDKYPNLLFIAEIYNPNNYRNYLYNGKFDLLYDKVGLYDTLRAVTCGQAPASNLTGCWQRVEDIQNKMLNFMENHDEQRIASDFYAGNGKKGRPGMIVATMMNTNPVMIYFGQELGERGMNEEGFSGLDGRTSIFDYCTVDSVRRWRNGGKFKSGLLNEEENDLRTFYQKILTLCNKDKAVKDGLFFDLMYVNQNNWNFDERHIFTFLRKLGNEVLLVAANFSDMTAHTGINIPQHAFDYLCMKTGDNFIAKDLLSEDVIPISLQPDKEVNIEIPANYGRIFKITQ